MPEEADTVVDPVLEVKSTAGLEVEIQAVVLTEVALVEVVLIGVVLPVGEAGLGLLVETGRTKMGQPVVKEEVFVWEAD